MVYSILKFTESDYIGATVANNLVMHGEHTLWLHISDQEATCIIRQTSRLRKIVQSLPSPSCQFPGFILLFESPETSCLSGRDGSTVHLRLESESAYHRQPMLIASSQSFLSHGTGTKVYGYTQCNTIQQTAFPRQESTKNLVALYQPFVDVLCFMCINLSDTRDIQAHIDQWCRNLMDATNEVPMPVVMILLAENYPLQPKAVHRFFLQRFPSLKRRLSIVKICPNTWARKGTQLVRARLQEAVSRSQQAKSKRKTLFSATHWMALFEQSFDQLTKSRPFRYIEAARAANPPAPDLAKHLSNYARALQTGHGHGFVAESIASSFILDHFGTSEMHGT